MIDFNQLMRARETLRMALSEAASAVGVGRSSVSLLECGRMEDDELAAKLRALYESLGIEFGPKGQIGFKPGLVKGADLGMRH